jgi:segregation and condensation protein A
MSKLIIDKPFWLKPPWIVLFDLIKLYRIKPWDVNIAYLLSSFLREMKKKGYIDFAASGTALLSSCIVLRLQSELVMKFEEPPKPPVEKPPEFIPPPVQIPFRYEYTSTTLNNLIEALEMALESELTARPNKLATIVPSPPEFFSEYDRFFVEIESNLNSFYDRLKMLSYNKIVLFSKIVEGVSRIEAVRTFLLLLFLAAKGWIQLWQEQDFGEIYITVGEAEKKIEPTLTV